MAVPGLTDGAGMQAEVCFFVDGNFLLGHNIIIDGENTRRKS